jgi:hypothetical protein
MIRVTSLSCVALATTLLLPAPVSPQEIGSKYTNIKLKVVQVINRKEFIGESGNELRWVRGVDTSNLVDGRYYDFEDQVFIVRGTKSYTTVLGGSKTVFLYEAETRAEERARRERDAALKESQEKDAKAAREKTATAKLKLAQQSFERGKAAHAKNKYGDAIAYLDASIADCNAIISLTSNAKEIAEAKQIRSEASTLWTDGKMELEASRRMKLAKKFAEDGLKQSARQRLQEIVEKFPKTKAAAEARELLEK